MLVRYIEWRKWIGSTLSTDWDVAPVSVELFDHQRNSSSQLPDPFSTETTNVAKEASYADVVKELALTLRHKFDHGY